MKNSKKFGVIKLICLCLIVAIVSAVPTIASIKNKVDGLEDKLGGDASDFQGILTIWNVDTFESGSQSKTVFLEEASRCFSKANKGLYFIIKNLTVEEMTANFINEVYPDIISFGVGIGDIVAPRLLTLSSNDFNGVRNEVLNSGMKDGELKAVGCLMGGYILASTEEKLGAVNIAGDVKLSSVLNVAGCDLETKNGVKHISSVVCGENKFIRPEVMSEVVFGLPLEDRFMSVSMYDAYVDFVGYNKGTILVGTQRDLFKLSGRVAVGKISGVRVEYIGAYTNLVQYVGVINGVEKERVDLAYKFVMSLISESCQKLSTKIGMVNVLKEQFYSGGEFGELENALSGDVIIPNVFKN